MLGVVGWFSVCYEVVELWGIYDLVVVWVAISWGLSVVIATGGDVHNLDNEFLCVGCWWVVIGFVGGLYF